VKGLGHPFSTDLRVDRPRRSQINEIIAHLCDTCCQLFVRSRVYPLKEEVDLPYMRNEALVSHTATAIAITSLFLFQMAMLAGPGHMSTH